MANPLEEQLKKDEEAKKKRKAIFHKEKDKVEDFGHEVTGFGKKYGGDIGQKLGAGIASAISAGHEFFRDPGEGTVLAGTVAGGPKNAKKIIDKLKMKKADDLTKTGSTPATKASGVKVEKSKAEKHFEAETPDIFKSADKKALEAQAKKEGQVRAAKEFLESEGIDTAGLKGPQMWDNIKAGGLKGKFFKLLEDKGLK